MLIEEFGYLASGFLSPMSRNSVLGVLRFKRFAVAQEEISWRTFWRWVMLESKSGGWKEIMSCVSPVQRWWLREREEMRVLSREVYMIKSKWPRTEPWEHCRKSNTRKMDSCLDVFLDTIYASKKVACFTARLPRCMYMYEDVYKLVYRYIHNLWIYGWLTETQLKILIMPLKMCTLIL